MKNSCLDTNIVYARDEGKPKSDGEVDLASSLGRERESEKAKESERERERQQERERERTGKDSVPTRKSYLCAPAGDLG